jgi:hypothetical protein
MRAQANRLRAANGAINAGVEPMGGGNDGIGTEIEKLMLGPVVCKFNDGPLLVHGFLRGGVEKLTTSGAISGATGRPSSAQTPTCETVNSRTQTIDVRKRIAVILPQDQMTSFSGEGSARLALGSKK